MSSVTAPGFLIVSNNSSDAHIIWCQNTCSSFMCGRHETDEADEDDEDSEGDDDMFDVFCLQSNVY